MDGTAATAPPREAAERDGGYEPTAPRHHRSTGYAARTVARAPEASPR
ncbi:MAG: hypothetical protein V7637_3680 [Mycobacteriales bacterium]|jgi:hypothetical protein